MIVRALLMMVAAIAVGEALIIAALLIVRRHEPEHMPRVPRPQFNEPAFQWPPEVRGTRPVRHAAGRNQLHPVPADHDAETIPTGISRPGRRH